MRQRALLFYAFLIFPFLLQAQKYSNEFLSIGLGARAHGMGGAVVATSADAASGYWNPAGYAEATADNQVQLGAMHAEWFAGIGKFDYLGAAIPMGTGSRAFGINLIRFGIDGIPNTLSLYEDDGSVNYDNIVEFSAADYALLLGYAQPLNVKKGKLLAGANLKIVYRQIGSFAQSWGFGLDFGLQYRLKNVRFGLMARDISTTVNAWSFSFTPEERDLLVGTGNDIPINSTEVTNPAITLGAAFDIPLKNILVTAELNAILTTDGKRNTLISGEPISISPLLGVEAGYKNFVFLRAGINNIQEERDFERSYYTVQPNLGLGLRIFRFYIDYAFTDIGNTGTGSFSHIISLKLGLKGKNTSKS